MYTSEFKPSIPNPQINLILNIQLYGLALAPEFQKKSADIGPDPKLIEVNGKSPVDFSRPWIRPMVLKYCAIIALFFPAAHTFFANSAVSTHLITRSSLADDILTQSLLFFYDFQIEQVISFH